MRTERKFEVGDSYTLPSATERINMKKRVLFNSYNEELFTKLIDKIPGLRIIKIWETGDAGEKEAG